MEDPVTASQTHDPQAELQEHRLHLFGSGHPLDIYAGVGELDLWLVDTSENSQELLFLHLKRVTRRAERQKHNSTRICSKAKVLKVGAIIKF